MQTSNNEKLINPIYCLSEVLKSVDGYIADAEARLAALRESGKSLAWGTIEERVNYLAQRETHGELLGLARAQGALEGRLSVTEIYLS